MKHIIDELNCIHKTDIIHRDLHCGNILYDDDKKIVVISDLGISKPSTELTNNNDKIYGVISYMAPEIFNGRKYTKASDIYSLV